MTRERMTAQLSNLLRALVTAAALAAAALCLPSLGCGSSSGGGESTPDASQPLVITVAGQVLSSQGEPLDGVKVWIADRESVTTGADGRFAFPDVRIPYALAASFGRVVKVLDALTSESPVVAFDAAAVNQRSSQIAGRLQGWEPPDDPRDTLVMFSFAATSSPCETMHEQSDVDADGAYQASFVWFCSDDSLTGVLDVLEYEVNAETKAVTYHTHGQKDALTLRDRGSLANVDVPMQPIEGQTLSGTAVIPAGMQPNEASFGGLARERRRLIPYGTLTWDATSGELRLPIPVVTGWAPFLSLMATPSIGSVAQTTLTWTGAANQTLIASPLTFLALPRQKGPADKAVDVSTADATLSWEGDLGAEIPSGAERVFAVVLRPSTAGRSRIEITTPSASLDVAALAALPVELERGEKYSWTVQAIERRGGEVLRTARSDLLTFTTAR